MEDNLWNWFLFNFYEIKFKLKNWTRTRCSLESCVCVGAETGSEEGLAPSENSCWAPHSRFSLPQLRQVGARFSPVKHVVCVHFLPPSRVGKHCHCRKVRIGHRIDFATISPFHHRKSWIIFMIFLSLRSLSVSHRYTSFKATIDHFFRLFLITCYVYGCLAFCVHTARFTLFHSSLYSQ